MQSGSVDVVISGGGAGREDDEVDASSTRGITVIRKRAGWHFGVLTLLFSTPRSASVLAHDNAVLWSLDRGTFLRFVLKHAHGARAVRFLRKLPLLNGLTDDKLVDIASRVREEVYEAGDYLINAGDRAVGLYVIRCAAVSWFACTLRGGSQDAAMTTCLEGRQAPGACAIKRTHLCSTARHSSVRVFVRVAAVRAARVRAARVRRYGAVVVKIGDKELSTLGRGKFVGERTLVTGKLRSASCVARTRVTAIVMQKRDFLEVDNPMLDWMIPYDAARAVLTHRPEMRPLTSDQFELLLDRFGSKTEVPQGRVLLSAGAMIDQLLVFITGNVELRDAEGAVRRRALPAPAMHVAGPVCRRPGGKPAQDNPALERVQWRDDLAAGGGGDEEGGPVSGGWRLLELRSVLTRRPPCVAVHSRRVQQDGHVRDAGSRVRGRPAGRARKCVPCLRPVLAWCCAAAWAGRAVEGSTAEIHADMHRLVLSSAIIAATSRARHGRGGSGFGRCV